MSKREIALAGVLSEFLDSIPAEHLEGSVLCGVVGRARGLLGPDVPEVARLPWEERGTGRLWARSGIVIAGAEQHVFAYQVVDRGGVQQVANTCWVGELGHYFALSGSRLATVEIPGFEGRYVVCCEPFGE